MDKFEIEIPYFLARRLKPSSGQCSVCSKQTKRLRRVECTVFYPGGANESLGVFTFCKKCHLRFNEISLIAREAIQQMDHFVPDAVRRWIETNHLLRLGQPDWNVSFPLNVFNALTEARKCFLFGFQLGCIVLSSASVELAINSDARRPSNWGSWKNMNEEMLQKALHIGCPVALLLDSNEITNGVIRRAPRPTFIERRNKYAHGEKTPSFMPFFSLKGIEEEALDQLTKCQQFLIEWALSQGNPIVAFDRCNEEEQNQDGSVLKFRVPAASLKIEFFNPWTIGRWY
jgi:hypothetical protein